MSTETVNSMTEEELREAKVPTPKTPEELQGYISALIERQHDYGTCVYAMSMAAEAAFNFVASKLGVTGFQASCADLDFLKRTRGYTMGFRVINYENLLYPQYCDDDHFPNWSGLIREHAEELSKQAKVNLEKDDGLVHPNVRAHWQMLAAMNGQGKNDVQK